MTGFADQRERASGLNAIVHDVVTKPFSVADIRTAVADALAARKGSGATTPHQLVMPRERGNPATPQGFREGDDRGHQREDAFARPRIAADDSRQTTKR